MCNSCNERIYGAYNNNMCSYDNTLCLNRTYCTKYNPHNGIVDMFQIQKKGINNLEILYKKIEKKTSEMIKKETLHIIY